MSPLTTVSVGRRSLVVGRWSLVVGRWSLVVGRWSERLEVSSCLRFTVLAAMSRLSLQDARVRVVECVEPATARVIR